MKYNLKLWKKRATQKLSAAETEFLPAILEIIETPPSPLGRITLWTIIALVLLALLWSILGQVDEVAVAPGKLIPSGNVKVLQAEDKGVVKKINVKDGQKVKQGEVLLELDPLFTAADFSRLRKELAYFTLETERLLAEREQRMFPTKGSPGMDEKDRQLQQRLYESRMAEFRAQKANQEQLILQSQSDLAMATSTRDRYQGMYDVAREKESRIQQLVEQDAVAYFVLLDHKSKRMELEELLAAAKSNIQKAEFALMQSQEALKSYMAGRNSEIDAKLVEDRKQTQALGEELKKAEEKNRLASIVSPIDGRVAQLSQHTVGGVVTAAQPLMVVVPDGVALEAETWVANKDIGFVQVGQKAEMKIETFNFQKFGTVRGEIIELSPDAVEDKEKGRVYRALMRLEHDNVIVEGHSMPLSPGMSVTAEIKTRRKRVIEYFLDPFRKYQSEGLRER